MKFELTKEIMEHFKIDPIMYKMMNQYPLPERGVNPDHFDELVRSIIFQQVSIKAGTTIFARLKSKYDITPDSLLNADTDGIQSVGLSFRKVEYIKALSKAVIEGDVHFTDMDQLDNKSIINMLIKVKGIGVWTAEMFLMFSLGRLDVNSYGDLAIRRGFKNLYQLDQEPTKKEFMEKVLLWSPYSTIAHFYLWFASGEMTFL